MHEHNHNQRDGEFTRTSMWLMMAGCCLSLPVALAVMAITGASLSDSRPWLLAFGAVLVVGLAISGLRQHLAEREASSQS
jgi:uncharacterized membrane protein YccC